MGKDSPSQPDPSKLMAQQSMANRLNVTSPFGNIRYTGSQDLPGTGKVERLPTGVNVTLSPEQKQLMRQSQRAQEILGQTGISLAHRFPERPAPAFDPTFNQPQARFDPTFDNPQARFDPTFDRPQARFAPGDFEAARLAAERAVFDRGMSLLRPELEHEEEALRQRLANQGLPQASRAFESELGRFERGRGEQMDRLAQSAVLQGLQAQQQGFGQGLATYQTEAQRRAQQFGQDIGAYQADAARRQQQLGADLAAYQADAARRQQTFGQDLAGFQASQAQRGQQLQEILGLFGLQPVQLPQMMATPQVDVPITGGGGGGPSPLSAGLSGGLSGAATGAMIGSAVPGLGTAWGAGLGGLFGLGAGLLG